MIKRWLNKAVRTGKGIARFAAMEIKERVTDNAPSDRQPANQEARAMEEDEENLPLAGEISAVKLKRQLASDERPVLVDCRDLHEWEAGYIGGCVHIPMDDLTERFAELDPQYPTVVYCLHGMRSAEVASWLKHK